MPLTQGLDFSIQETVLLPPQIDDSVDFNPDADPVDFDPRHRRLAEMRIPLISIPMRAAARVACLDGSEVAGGIPWSLLLLPLFSSTYSCCFSSAQPEWKE